jgi:hypothetical protein
VVDTAFTGVGDLLGITAGRLGHVHWLWPPVAWRPVPEALFAL